MTKMKDELLKRLRDDPTYKLAINSVDSNEAMSISNYVENLLMELIGVVEPLVNEHNKMKEEKK